MQTDQILLSGILNSLLSVCFTALLTPHLIMLSNVLTHNGPFISGQASWCHGSDSDKFHDNKEVKKREKKKNLSPFHRKQRCAHRIRWCVQTLPSPETPQVLPIQIPPISHLWTWSCVHATDVHCNSYWPIKDYGHEQYITAIYYNRGQ